MAGGEMGRRWSRGRPVRVGVLSVAAAVFGAGDLAAAPGVFATETPPTPLAAPWSVIGSGPEAAITLDGAVGVLQPFGANAAQIRVPICVSRTRGIGHAYAIPHGTGRREICRTDTQPNPIEAPILKPTAAQMSTVYWVPLQKGGALPRTLAPLYTNDANGVPMYACKVAESGMEQVGMLLPDGSCRLAPYLGGRGGRVESSSLVLVRAGSGGASAAPAFGWIYPKDNGHHPGGTLVKWPGGAAEYCQARVRGELYPGRLETNADGSIKECGVIAAASAYTVTQAGSSESLSVFRNDDDSKVQFEQGAPANVARVTVGGRVPCTFERSQIWHRGYLIDNRCKTPTYVQAAKEIIVPHELVRRGPWPDQG